MRVAAVQLQPVIGDIDANLAACERLADRAAAEGAEWIILPEFFTTGAGFFPELARRSLPPGGVAAELLLSLARRHGAAVGGSFLCRDADGQVRNAFLLATPEGFAGRHDKDIPTMWENCFYVGGADDGLMEARGLTAGVALCLEFNRTRTVGRLRGKADIVVGGSFKWGAPAWMPFRRRLQSSIERYTDWAPRFARLVGCPVVEATHCGPLRCKTPMLPLPYDTRLGGGATVCDAAGNVLARRGGGEGEGVVVADVEAARVEPDIPVPPGFWIRELDPVSKAGWHAQGWHGRRWYRRHVAPRAGRA
ncbi:MAG TPA: carbon-nitrogen hydrolase family protein [Pyrinomonadaceae bacterium]|nr:carbon-nitrogen hydrolase family protein [Pyrinomonadaceae bacterium]